MSSRWMFAGLGLAASAAFGISGYFIYKYFKNNEDEGFVEPITSDPQPKRVVVLGLDGAGKSQILAALGRHDLSADPKPTEGFNVISIQTSNGSLDVWEIGGSQTVRKYWPNFLQDTSLLVFVVDSSDYNRFPEAYNEMHKLIGDPTLINKPFLVLANKQDKEKSASVEEIKAALGLIDIKHHRVKIIATAVTKTQSLGVEEARKLFTSL